jgi:hypothetical protein
VGIAFAWACSCGDPCDPYTDPTCSSSCFDFGPYGGGDYVFVDGSIRGSEPDGSEFSPFAHIGPAIHAAGRRGGGIVAVASGEYVEQIELGPEDHGVVVVSVCAAEHVRIRGKEGADAPVISMRAAPHAWVGLAGLQIEASEAGGLEVWEGTLMLTQVEVHDTVGSAIVVSGPEARLEADDLVVQTVSQDEAGNGFLMVVVDGGELVVDGLVGSGASVALGLVQGADSQLTLLDAQLDGSPLLEDEESMRAAGIVASDGASVQLTAVTMSQLRGVGVELSLRSSGTLEQVTLRGVVPAESEDGGLMGSGVTVLSGSGLTARELVVDTTVGYGLAASDRGSWVDWVGGSLLYSSADEEIPGSGIGLLAANGANVTVSELELRDQIVFSAVSSGEDSELLLTDVQISEGRGGGLLAQQGAGLLAERVTIDGPHGFGVAVDDSSAELLEVDITDTVRGSAQTLAVGVLSNAGSTLQARSLLVEGTQGAAFVATGAVADCTGCTLLDNTFAGVVAVGSLVEIVDSTLSGTGPDATLGGGFGVFADGSEFPFELLLTGSVLDDHELAAVYVRGPGSALIEDTVLVGGPAQRSVWPTGTAVFASGTASGPYGLQLVSNTLRDSEGAGLFLDGGTATLSGNLWEGNTVDIWQQLCADALPPPGLEQEQADTIVLCPPYDQLVELLSFDLEYEPLQLSP